ncbi:hypothetical protein FOFC_20593 [Fusarium oxysporum]|nr:hypothetical protein FOFC_20593 [Fusarium oxysporum]
MKLLSVVTTLAILSTTVSTGPVAYGVCQAGCAGVVMACYGAAGLQQRVWDMLRGLCQGSLAGPYTMK